MKNKWFVLAFFILLLGIAPPLISSLFGFEIAIGFVDRALSTGKLSGLELLANKIWYWLYVKAVPVAAITVIVSLIFVGIGVSRQNPAKKPAE